MATDGEAVSGPLIGGLSACLVCGEQILSLRNCLRRCQAPG
jgi:hypothetical protein